MSKNTILMVAPSHAFANSCVTVYGPATGYSLRDFAGREGRGVRPAAGPWTVTQLHGIKPMRWGYPLGCAMV